jgi:predicted aldo/keto reductase-like oxidoreductase
MIYRRFGKTNIQLSALGIGTNRFKVDSDTDIDESVKIIQHALTEGVNYIDVAYIYSKGKAEEIVRRALKQSKWKVHITLKSGNGIDRTAADAYFRAINSLKNMECDRASFFVAWGIKSYKDFLEMTSHGSLYEGALRLKDEGLVDHICASLHCPVDDIIKIMESGLFSGVTISYSVLNQSTMQNVLDKAAEYDIGIITMNSLGGGIIPQNPDFFSFLKYRGNETISQAALVYSYAHPQITTMLSGMATYFEFKENINALLKEEASQDAKNRISLVNKQLQELNGFCTGCRYCDDCQQGINIPEMMQSYNSIFFTGNTPLYRRTGKRLLENINICKKLKQDFHFIPEDTFNPCTKCQKCEKKCTQSIPIIKRLEELYVRFEESAYSRRHIKEKLEMLLSRNYSKIAFYPGASYTSLVLGYLHDFVQNFHFEIFLFDGNEKLWGTFNNGIEIQNPDKLSKIKPDIVIISNYTYDDEIYISIQHFESVGIKVVKLHGSQDVPWGF